MEKMLKTTWLSIGLLIGVVGTLGSQLAYNAFINIPSSSEWVIPQTAFGEYDIQPSDLSEAEIYGDETPSFISELSFNEYVAYGDQYIVGYFVDESLVYNGNTYYYTEYRLSIMSATGVNIWTHSFELTEAFSLGAIFSSNNIFEINHMLLEGDFLIIIFEFVNRITYFNPFTETEITVDNGDEFNLVGASEEAKNYIQSFVRFNIEAKTFHVIGVNDADTPMFDDENFEKIEPFRYALAQEFDNLNEVAFSHNYYGETLTFTEQTSSIALLTEVSVHPTQFSATFQTVGKWSSTSAIDIDLEGVVDTKQTSLEIVDTGLMHIDIAITLENETEKDNLANNVMTADDNLLTNNQQSLINNASSRYTEDETMQRLQIHIVGIIDEDFNKVSIDIMEEVQSITSNGVNSEMLIYWIKDLQFVYITVEEEFNIDGLKVSCRSIIRFKNGDTVNKTFDLQTYGDVIIEEFIMDDSGNMIIAGEFIESESNPIQNYARGVVLFMNKDFQILDEFIIDSDGVNCYINKVFVDENQLRIYLNISDQTGLFENIPLNTWIVVFTIELI